MHQLGELRETATTQWSFERMADSLQVNCGVKPGYQQ
jgi:hypothetical protein